MKKRILYYEIKKHLDHKNALVITGMRQVGKTTLMKQIFDELEIKAKLWFDLDNPLDQKVFENVDYNNIYEDLLDISQTKEADKLFVFIDEIQNFPAISKVIKYLIDYYGVKFIVTGSSSFYLKNLFPESLSGRKFLYQLNPMNFREYLYFLGFLELGEATQNKFIPQKKSLFSYQKLIREYKNYLRFGGFPEVVLTDDRSTKKQILKNIFASFFEKDLQLLSDFKDIRELRDLILLLAPRVGSMMDISKLASELKLHRPKIYAYLEFLQGVFFVKLLPKFSKSIDRSVAAGKKIYFSDTGILNILGKVNEAQIFENAVLNQLYSYGELSFYNNRKQEIDFILDKKIAFEVKLKGSLYDLNRLKKISQKLGIERNFLLTQEYQDHQEMIEALFL